MTTPNPVDALKPCPFCGSPAVLIFGNDGDVCNVRCSQWSVGVCLGAGPNSYHKEKAIAGWNRRAAVEASARALAAVPAADDVLPKIVNELRIMLGSATELSDGIGDIVGYQIKTGALHRILGLLSGAGHPVAIAAKHQSVALPPSQQAGGVPAGFVNMKSLEPVIQWLEAGCDPKHAATELRLLAAAPSPGAVQPTIDKSMLKRLVTQVFGEEFQIVRAVQSLSEARIDHRPGCDALGGYGHGVGPCSCGIVTPKEPDHADQA